MKTRIIISALLLLILGIIISVDMKQVSEIERAKKQKIEETKTKQAQEKLKQTEQENTVTPAKQKEIQSKFIHACRWGNLEEVKKLFTLGADVNGNSLGATPLKNAVLGGNSETVSFLLDKGATVTPDILTIAENSAGQEIQNLLANKTQEQGKHNTVKAPQK